jgi:ankyrin repeat protein
MSAKVKGEKLKDAAYEGKTDEILRLWEENGATLDVEHEDCIGWTPLHVAARYGHGEACRVLISTCRATVDVRDYGGCTPLMNAAYWNSLQCVEVLLEMGADITLQNNDMTALEFAREKGHAEVVAILEAASITMVKSARKV